MNGGVPLVRGLVVTVPKSGTHLVDSTLARLPDLARQEKTGLNRKLEYHPLNFIPVLRGPRCTVGIGRPRTARLAAVKHALSRIKPNRYGMAQLPFDERVAEYLAAHDYRVVIGVRDPRDVLVSLLHHIAAKPAHYLHGTLKAMISDRERLLALIHGVRAPDGERRESVAHQLRLVSGWLGAPFVFRVRFEDLVGARGGGSEAAQVAAIIGLAAHLKRPVDAAQALAIGTGMYGGGRTFRRGQIGAWREAFDPQVRAAFLEVAGPLLPALGYSAAD